MKSITHHMAKLWLILLIAPLVAFAPENAAARSFSGGSHTTGGGRTTSRSNPSSTFRSYQTPKSETPRSGTDRVQQKKYRINRDNNRQTRYQSYRSQPRQGGIMSDFGRSLTRGIGWGVGWSIVVIWEIPYGILCLDLATTLTMIKTVACKHNRVVLLAGLS